MASLAEQFAAQPIDAQMNQIRAWVQQNPSASTADISNAMSAYGVAPQTVAMAVGNTPIPNAPPELKVAQYQAVTGSRANTTDINRGIVARNLGITANDLIQSGVSPEQAQRIIDAAQLQNATAGQVSDEQIRAYAIGNPNASPSQIQAAMAQYGVDPLQAARALGQDVNQVRNTVAQGIPTGLQGYEEAARAGIAQATGTLQDAETRARGDLGPAMEEVARLYGLNIDDLRQAGQVAREDIQSTYGQAGQMFQPYQQAGNTALQQQLALSGALGQDAFNQAYQESPYIQFLREQGERSTLAGAAATGGLGGGRVQQELVRFGQGLAGQGLQQQIGNLSALSGMGMQSAGAGADILTGMGTNLANLGTGTAQGIAGQRQGLAGETSQYGANLANLATSTGTNIANLQAQYAQNLANQRMNAGQLLAGQIGGVTSGISGLAESQGLNLSNLLNQYGTAGLGLSQGAINNQIGAMQNAANQESAMQQQYANTQSGLVAGQPMQQQQPFNYGQAIGGAFNAAALGTQMFPGQTPQTSQPYSGYMSPGFYGNTQAQQPIGSMNNIPGVAPFNVLNTDLMASRLTGVI
jgi:hypothetical protein